MKCTMNGKSKERAQRTRDDLPHRPKGREGRAGLKQNMKKLPGQPEEFFHVLESSEEEIQFRKEPVLG